MHKERRNYMTISLLLIVGCVAFFVGKCFGQNSNQPQLSTISSQNTLKNVKVENLDVTKKNMDMREMFCAPCVYHIKYCNGSVKEIPCYISFDSGKIHLKNLSDNFENYINDNVIRQYIVFENRDFIRFFVNDYQNETNTNQTIEFPVKYHKGFNPELIKKELE